ncbi:unnamed protein product [Candidula unifasciata]|uniref:Uncharacterized protein n=1 Tax=Candidula unifasciata TaxID=100452 RepID=A0A8S3YEG3_9EUPU|nr:unnamed protein product [Candidula unifasciata]
MTGARQAVRTESQLKYSSNYKRSTLPYLLAEYGLESTESFPRLTQQERAKTRARTAPLKQKQKSSSFLHFDEERARRKQTERDEHCLKLIQDMHRLRDYYYQVYTRRLAEKVEKQRKEIKEKDLQSREKRIKKEEEERRSSHRLKKRLEYHVAETSVSSDSVPKTDLYYIVGLEDKLVREGKLKTMDDLNKFRFEIEDPHVFYSTFKVTKSTGVKKMPGYSLDQISRDNQNRATDTQPLTADNLAEMASTGQALRSLTRISEFRESKPDISSDSWAITQQYQKRTSMSGLPTSRQKTLLQSDFDRRFPKVEMPKLHCFTMDLATKQPDPTEVQQKAELKAKQKQRKRLMRKIAKMYQLAMSNIATSARILSQHEDMDILFNGPALSDVIARQHWAEADISQASEQVGEAQDLGQSQEVGLSQEVGQSEEVGLSQEVGQSEEVGLPDHQMICHEVDLPVEERNMALPLTMEEIQDNMKILESKSLSTFWTNYLGAGK